MRVRTARAMAAAGLAALLAGCSPQGAELEIIPARPACTVPKVVAVRWTLPEHEPLPAVLKINGPGTKMRSWHGVSAHQGEAETGPWASDGLTVTLVSKSGRPLARRTLTRGPCEEG